MVATPNYVSTARKALLASETELVSTFGREALEESGLSIYTNRFPPAAYLAWSRVAHAQRLLAHRPPGGRALDFGSGFGVMLPFLSQTCEEVTGFDQLPAPTAMMVERMGLPNVTTRAELTEADTALDLMVAPLDVLEHVEGLEGVMKDLYDRTASGGIWIISGPTENWFYRAMRLLSRTTGEGHERTIYDVFDALPTGLKRERVVRLPFGSSVPLFLVGRFVRTA